jgi:hypothetical protein
MKRMVLLFILGGLLLFGAGCGGGGGSSGGGNGSEDNNSSSTVTIDNYVQGTYPIGLYYTFTNTSGDKIKMTIDSIEVRANKSLRVYCTWTATNNSGRDEIIKATDEYHATFYLVDNNGEPYYHTYGTGAAYTTTVLNPTAEGSYYFPALNSGVTSFYFYDSICSKKSGWIKFNGI